MRKWEDLPRYMKCDEVKKYYDILAKHKVELKIKRVFDFIMASLLLVLCAVPMAVIAVLIVRDSDGGVFYRQERVTAYGKKFRIHKFRTMTEDAERTGAAVTVKDDVRITKIGKVLRKYRLDELPQLLDIISADMTFVGTRPESVKYVKKYTPEMYATLLLPAGVTSEASIRYKDEAELLDGEEDVDRIYLEQILPRKMKYNLGSIKKFSIFREAATMVRTILAVLGKEYE